MIIACQNEDGSLSDAEVRLAVEEFFAAHDYTDKKILLIVPDDTRSGPIDKIFHAVFDCIGKKVKSLDILVALGTHQPMTEEQICSRVGIRLEERAGKFAAVKFFNHHWTKPETFRTIGTIPASEIEKITEGLFTEDEDVEVSVNGLIFDYDEFFILGPVFPHEVVGFSGGHKYIFPGIADAPIINFFHWVGAVITNLKINGNKWTAPRAIVERAAAFINVPHKLFAAVAVNSELKGLFIGDCLEAWEKAADVSQKVHIVYKQRPYKMVLGIAPAMYDDLWTAGKVMYKLEPIVADGGTLIIYAPHIREISYSHGKIIDRIGYHTRDYFLAQMGNFAGIPRGVMAHCTHVKGIGTYINGVEKPRVNVVLATGISESRCRKVNLGYINPKGIKVSDYENRENEGILVVHRAGEILHRLTGGYIPTIPKE